MKTLNLFFACCLCAVSIGCSDDDTQQPDPTGVEIRSFRIDGIEGAIDRKRNTILVQMPQGTDLSALTPQITLSENSTVTPASGQACDFTASADRPVEYTVFSGDRYNVYRVTVEEFRPQIRSITVGEYSGYIDQEQRIISVYVPLATDLKALATYVDTNVEGGTLAPSSGSVVDYTDPVSITLTYDGIDYVYVTTVYPGKVMIYDGECVDTAWDWLFGWPAAGEDNPVRDGANTSRKCVAFPRVNGDTDEGGRTYSGGALWNDAQVNLDPAAYGSFSLLVLKEIAGPVVLELQAAGQDAKSFLTAEYTNPGRWQELRFDIPFDRTAPINNILVQIHATDAPFSPSPQLMYWDELAVYERIPEPRIERFTINGVDGTIDQTTRTITVSLPRGTSLAGLAPGIGVPEGATVSPAANVPQDFTRPVAYTVRLGDREVTYRVSVYAGMRVIYNGENVTRHWDALSVDRIDDRTDNPRKAGVNTSATCVSVVRNTAGDPWAGGAIWGTNALQLSSEVYSSFSLLVLKETAGKVTLEIQEELVPGTQTKCTADALYTTPGEWQRLTFTLPGEFVPHRIDNVIVQIHNEPAGSFPTQTMYWDELLLIER